MKSNSLKYPTLRRNYTNAISIIYLHQYITVDITNARMKQRIGHRNLQSVQKFTW